MSVKWNGAVLTDRFRQGAMQGVSEWIGLVDERAVNLIVSPPKTGRIYRRRGVEHQASAPGEAPATDQGTLVNNRRIDLFPERLAARLTFSAAHALPLEVGSLNMEPRPFAARALRETADAGRERVQSRMAAMLK